MKDTSTKFPNEIDPRIFFSDVDLDHLDVLNEHKTLISSESYTNASELLNGSEIDFYGAWLLNLLENRLEAIGSFLLQKSKPNLQVYSNNEPVAKMGLHWIV